MVVAPMVRFGESDVFMMGRRWDSAEHYNGEKTKMRKSRSQVNERAEGEMTCTT
jgi:hypothetical protein